MRGMMRPRSRLKVMSTACLFAIAMTFVSGCKSRTGDSSRSMQQEKVTICIGGGAGLAVMLAQMQNAFSDAGIEVTLKKYSAGTLAFDAMVAGECDMSTPPEMSIVLKSFQQQDFGILATLTTSDRGTQILANKQSGIQKPKDLKGKRILVHKGSSNQFWLEQFLMRNGLTPEDVTMIFDDIKDVTAALKAGLIDAFCGADLIILAPRKAMGSDAAIFSYPGLSLYSFNLVSMNSFTRERPEVIRRVLSGLLKNAENIRKDPKKAIKVASAALNIDKPDMANIIENYDWDVELTQTLILSLEQEAQWAIRTGLTNKADIPNYLNVIHPEFLQSLKPEAVSLIKQVN